MRTIISGLVTDEHLQDADLLADITPTSFVTNGLSEPPVCSLTTEVYPVCTMRDHAGAIIARDYTLIANADALVCVGYNPHLVDLARTYDLPVYEVSE